MTLKAKRIVKIIVACIYSLLWFAGALTCLISSTLFMMLIGKTWGYSYGDMTVRSCNAMSATGLATSIVCGVYMWFALLGLPQMLLSPSWLIKKLGLSFEETR